MAIKVKHEGNATSRIAAAGAGGKGRRRAEDAKAMMQIASQENMANRKPIQAQFVHANAQSPGSAPLVSAPSGGSAPLMSAPGISSPRPLPNNSHTTFSPVTKMGRKYRNGVADATARAAAGLGASGGNGAPMAKLYQKSRGIDKFQLIDESGRVVRSYTQGEMDDLMERGDAGGLTGWDQVAYFRRRGGKTDEEKRAEAEEKARQERAAEIERQKQEAVEKAKTDAAEFDRREGVRAQNRQEEAQRQDEASRRDYIRKGREKEGYNYKQVIELEDLESQLAEAKANGDNEAANEIQGKINSIVPKNKPLSPQGQRERAALVNDIVEGVKSGKFTPEEVQELMKQYEEAADRISMADQLRDKEPTAQEKFEKSIVTDAEGNRFYQKANGEYVPLPNPTADAAAADAKKQEAEKQKRDAEQAKAAQARAAHRQKFIDTAIDNARKNSLTEGGPTTEELIAARDAAAKQYDELYPAAPNDGSEAIGQSKREAAARGDLNPLEMKELGLLPDGFSVKNVGKGVAVFDQDGNALGAFMDDGTVMKFVRNKDGEIAGNEIVEKSAAPWLKSNPASAAIGIEPPAEEPVPEVATNPEEAKRKWGVKGR